MFEHAVCVVLVVCLLGPSIAAAQPQTMQPPVAPPPFGQPPINQPPVTLPPREPPATPPALERVPPRSDVRSDTPVGAIAGSRIIPGPDYRLGPGDLLEVQVAGRLDVTRHQLVVDLDGTINVSPLGVIQVGGLTLIEAYRRIVERARLMFRYVEVTVSIVTPRSFEVVISGDVARPGAIVTSAFRRLHEIVHAVGGITPAGSLRRVRLTQKGVSRELDLLKFELAGDLSQNPFVDEGTAIHVPPRGPSVTLTGAVRRPGEYELGPTGGLAEVLALTGGLAPSAARADTRLTRIAPDGRKETFAVDLGTAIQRPTDVPLHPGDVLFVPSVSGLQDLVEVRGAFVGTPETARSSVAGKPIIVHRLELAQSERVADIVRRVGGPAAFADLRLALVERRGAGGPIQRIPVDLHRLLVDKDERQNIALENGDVLLLPPAEDRVFVLGEVRTPGPQDFRPELGIREYIALAGGPGSRAKLPEMTVTFRNGLTYAVDQSPPLEPGAVVTVPEVSVKWWQDYVAISRVVIDLIGAYTGLYILFGGRVGGVFGTTTDSGTR